MKTIYIIRHAKAGSSPFGDFDRKLNEQGLKAAHLMAELLEEKNVVPNLVLASPAARTMGTAEIFCDILNYPKESVEPRMEIYEGGAGRLLTIVQQVADSNDTVLIFGHNPTVTSLANLLSGGDIASMATCGVVRLDLDIAAWNDTAANTGTLAWYEFPKKYQ